jgi:hypothetical protein
VNWNFESKDFPPAIPFVCLRPVTTAVSPWMRTFMSLFSNTSYFGSLFLASSRSFARVVILPVELVNA